MSLEAIEYNHKEVFMDNVIVSWIQKFILLNLDNKTTPEWFHECLDDLEGNYHVPYGKYFFDEEIINSKEKNTFILDLLDIIIEKMAKMTLLEFWSFIEKATKGSWCELNTKEQKIYSKKNLNKIYLENYIEPLLSFKKIIEDSIE